MGCLAADLLTTHRPVLLACAGIQAQTAECLVVSELVTNHLVVVLNKVDLLPVEQRDRLVAKARKRLAATFALTKFKGCAMVPVAAKPGALSWTLSVLPGACTYHSADSANTQVRVQWTPSSHTCNTYGTGSAPCSSKYCCCAITTSLRCKCAARFGDHVNSSQIPGAVSVCAGGGDEEAKAAPVGVDQLMQELAARLPPRPRSPEGPFLFAVDHCFAIRGQGTVLTGTVLQVLCWD